MSPIHIPPIGSVVFFQGRDFVARSISWLTLPLSVYVYALAVVGFIVGAIAARRCELQHSYFACIAASVLGIITIYVLGNISKPSHVGIIAEMPIDGDTQPMLVEATTQCDLPCAIQRRLVSGVQVHDYDARVMGYDGRVWLYEPLEPLTDSQCAELTARALSEVGRDYSALGAMASATRIIKWFRHVTGRYTAAQQWCSTLVVKLLKHIDRYPLGKHSDRSPAAVERDLRDTEQWVYRKVR